MSGDRFMAHGFHVLQFRGGHSVLNELGVLVPAIRCVCVSWQGVTTLDVQFSDLVRLPAATEL